jgi:hypothetical protein
MKTETDRVEFVRLTCDVARAEVRDRFAASEAVQLMAALDATPLPLLEGSDRDRERDRVHMAILKLTRGEMGRFQQALAMARLDWRDALVNAGLAPVGSHAPDRVRLLAVTVGTGSGLSFAPAPSSAISRR